MRMLLLLTSIILMSMCASVVLLILKYETDTITQIYFLIKAVIGVIAAICCFVKALRCQ